MRRLSTRSTARLSPDRRLGTTERTRRREGEPQRKQLWPTETNDPTGLAAYWSGRLPTQVAMTWDGDGVLAQRRQTSIHAWRPGGFEDRASVRPLPSYKVSRIRSPEERVSAKSPRKPCRIPTMPLGSSARLADDLRNPSRRHRAVRLSALLLR